MARQKLSELVNEQTAVVVNVQRVIINGRDTLQFVDFDSGAIQFQVSPDDLFDADGNLFEVDNDWKR